MSLRDRTDLENEPETSPIGPTRTLVGRPPAPPVPTPRGDEADPIEELDEIEALDEADAELELDQSLYELTVLPVVYLSARERPRRRPTERPPEKRRRPPRLPPMEWVDEAETGVCDMPTLVRLREQARAEAPRRPSGEKGRGDIWDRIVYRSPSAAPEVDVVDAEEEESGPRLRHGD